MNRTVTGSQYADGFVTGVIAVAVLGTFTFLAVQLIFAR